MVTTDGVGDAGKGGLGLWLIILFLTEWLYPAVFEVCAGGVTLGKKALGPKVIHANGTPVDWPGALIRNLLRAVADDHDAASDLAMSG